MPIESNFLQLNSTTFAYEGAVGNVVSSINWSIPEGGIHCLVGRSGCGKTTLLKLAAGLLQPVTGTVRVLGTDVPEPSQHVGFVFQSPSLLEWQTVLNNVLLPISLHGTVTATDHIAANELLQLVGLQEHTDRYPRQLSGGQQSRVALARALITEPIGLLMDEPFAALDAITREELQDDLLQLASLRKTTVLFVTHDIGEAVYLADKVAVMDAGRIVFSTDVALPRPRNQTQRYSSLFNATCLNLRNAMGPERKGEV
tara:strand:+ start:159 stop:929 length:771 start_codon:yes stop_codon:yes gene_type:complete